MSAWISVKERLPEQYQDVLVYTEPGLISLGFMTDQRKWDCVCNSLCYVDVTHWQPLPEPPEER